MFTTAQPTSDLSHQLFTLSFETKRKTNFIDFLLLTFAIKLQKQFLQNNKIGERFENCNNLRPLSFFGAARKRLIIELYFFNKNVIRAFGERERERERK